MKTENQKIRLKTYAFHVKRQDISEVRGQSGQQGVVADVAGEVCHGQCIQWHTFKDLQPRNVQSSLQQHPKTTASK